MALDHCFLVPPLHGEVTGGTLYNRELVRALSAAGLRVAALDLEAARGARAGHFWVDSLFLHALPELVRVHGARVGLIAHYLPSLVLASQELGGAERAALAAAPCFLAPSEFMQRELERLRRRPATDLVVEPGCLVSGVSETTRARPLRALMVANLTAGKGILPFLRALSRELTSAPDFRLRIAGAASERDYATRCQSLVRGDAALARRVEFLGALEPEAVAALLAESDLFVSASRFESYGMALAEARTAGVPILAREGGNAAAHVSAERGGELARDDGALARAFVHLCADEEEHARRSVRARQHAPAPRSWHDAARDFVAQVVGSGLGRKYDQ